MILKILIGFALGYIAACVTFYILQKRERRRRKEKKKKVSLGQLARCIHPAALCAAGDKTMEGQVPEELKEERRDEIMELQQEISLEKGNDRIGQELLVMIEGKVSGESAYIGRTYGDAPKVDGYMFVQTGELLVTGDFAKVKVTGAMEYDLIGELADEYTE